MSTSPARTRGETEAVSRNAGPTGEPPWSARRTITGPQGAVASIALIALGAGLEVQPLLVARLALTVATVVFLSSIVLRSVYSLVGMRAVRGGPVPLTDRELPSYTVVVALYREAPVAAALCESLRSLDYPQEKLQVILACEEHDVDTIEVCHEHASEDWLVLAVPAGEPQTKPRALNAALAEATGALITIYDAEDIPDPDQLRKAAAAFAAGPDRIGSLQARLEIHNESESIISRCFSVEYLTLFDSVLPGMAALGQPMPLGGTSTHFRTAVVRQVGGWDPWNVTEDCELGIRLAANGYQSAVLDSATMEEAVTTVRAWINQRSRWVKGYAQTALVMLRRPFATAREMGPSRYAAGLVTVASVPLVLLAQPVFAVLVGIYLIDVIHHGRSSLLTPIFPEPLTSVAMVAFVAGFFLLIFCHVLAVHRANRPRLVGVALLMPAYLLLASVAAWKGCLQLINRPHFWDKTSHGESQSRPIARSPRPAPPASADAVSNSCDVSSGASSNGDEPAAEGQPGADASGRRLDPWLLSLSAVSVVVLAISAYRWRGTFLDYSDAPAHLNTAHRLIDNASPGLDQLGLHWLPAYHLLEAPFAAFEPLYRSGWAGSIASIIAASAAIVFLYRLAIQCGARQIEATAVGLAVLAQSAFLYVSVVPMHYSLLIATTTASIFYLSRWLDKRRTRDLVLSGTCVTLATLTHFDSWILLAIECLVVAVAAFRARSRDGLHDDLLVWLVFAASGVCLFFFLNIWWKGDPLAFINAVADGGNIITQSHGGLLALADHPRAVWVLAGPLLTILGGVGAAVFAWRWRRRPSRFVAILLLYPLAFFALQAVTAGSLIEPATAVADWRNLRYGATMVPALTFFAIVGWSRWHGLALVASALLIGISVTQLAHGHNPAMAEAAGDIPAPASRSLDEAGNWLRQRVGGRRAMVLRSSLQERFELLSGMPGSQFIDDNDAPFDSIRSGRIRPESERIGWLVRIRRIDEGSPLTPIPAALAARIGAKPCISFNGLRAPERDAAKGWVTIWRVDGAC